jgi:hypothetical protein
VMRGAALALACAAFAASTLLTGCGGSSEASGVGGSGEGIAGNYSGRVEMTTDRFGVFTIAVKDSTGVGTTGRFYILHEDQPEGRSRHAGAHEILAQVSMTGTADPNTRAVTLNGDYTENGQRISVTLQGTLKKKDVDPGAMTVHLADQTYTGTFD